MTGHHVGADALQQLRDAYGRFRADATNDSADRFHASTWNGRSAADRDAYSAIHGHLLPELRGLTDGVSARMMPSVFQIKPSSSESGLAAHQDSFLVDERREAGVYGWVGLTESTVDNGALFVLPGSHRWARWPRAASETDDLARFQQVIRRHARVLSSAAGQVVLFDNAMIHGSLVNRSAEVRVAASFVVVPGHAEVVVPVPSSGPGEGRLDLRSIVPATVGQPGDAQGLGPVIGTAYAPLFGFGVLGLTLACRLNRMLRPGAPGTRIPADQR